MSQGNRPTPLQQRVEIWEQAQQGKCDAEIAAAMQLSPVTVRKWRRRAQRQGRSALGAQVGRPKRGALGAASPELRQTIRQLRADHPGWGPETLRLALADALGLPESSVPSRSRLAVFLKAEGVTRRYERRSELVQPAAQKPAAPHEEWEMDAQGVRQVVGVGRVSLINVGDPYSHGRVGSLACLAKSKAVKSTDILISRHAVVGMGSCQITRALAALAVRALISTGGSQ